MTSKAFDNATDANRQQGGRRNLIINGAMQVAQRGTSTSITHQQAEFVTDRFQTYEGTAGSLDVEQSTTAPDGFYYSTKWTVTSADTSLASNEQAWVRQRVEGYNMAHLGWGTSAAQTVTLSFWVRSSVTGTFAGSFQNSAGNRVYPYIYTISSADTWEYKQVTIEGDTSGTWLKTNGNGCTIYWSFGMASNLQGTAGAWASSSARTASGETQLIANNSATWYITGVQLEVGTVATPFEHRSYGEELALCQRYYYEYSSGSGGRGIIGVANNYSSTASYCPHQTPVPMRTIPSLSVDESGNDLILYFNGTTDSTDLSNIVLSSARSSVYLVRLEVTTDISVTQGTPASWEFNNTANTKALKFDAEL